MKRLFYIGAFLVLGLLLATLLHAGIEISLLAWMQVQLETGKTSVLLKHRELIHGVGGKLLWFGGGVAGFALGRKFWRILYIERRYGTPRW